MIQMNKEQLYAVLKEEAQISAIRSSGPGGQNVNKVSTGIHLRFNIKKSSLPTILKQKILNSVDKRINKADILVIKAQRHRTKEKNHKDAILRLVDLIYFHSRTNAVRQPTKPSFRQKQKRLHYKSKISEKKIARSKVIFSIF
tara:strand:- start:423 stop:851 length:429 start_codon:yes stop_codon:yes gene_type:complete